MSRSIADRLIEWEECRERGETPSVADLCADDPDQLPELVRLIGLLEGAERLLDVYATNRQAAAATAGGMPQRSAAALPGRLGRYVVRAELGRGATCVVYRAWDPELRREVALKVLHVDTPLARQQQATLAARLGREAQALARLRHEHIVPIYEPGLSDGRPYFVLEYVRGGTLRDWCVRLSEAGPRTFVPLLERTARAVQHAHEHGILHRDLKPANILLSHRRDSAGSAQSALPGPASQAARLDALVPLVSDFGLAKLLDDVPAAGDEAEPDTVLDLPAEAADASTRLTATGFQPGTPAYMAPEQYDPSFGDVGPATDVWALGVILYELLTGDRPFGGQGRAEVRARVCGGQRDRPRQRKPGADRRLEAIVLRCLQTDPRQRYGSAGELADALAAWQKRRLFPRFLAGAALLACLTLPAAFLWLGEASPERRYQAALATRVNTLRRNEAVGFVAAGAAQLPPYRVRAGERSTTVSPTADGLLIYGRAGFCLVEFCPEVPLRHYRLRARVRLERLQADGAWGVYVNHTTVNTLPGPQSYFEAAAFLDSAGLRPGGAPTAVPTVRAALKLRWYSEHHPSSGPGPQYPFRDVDYTPDPKRTFVEQAVAATAWDHTSWRTIRIEVHAAEVAAHCAGGGLERELDLGIIQTKNRANFLRVLRGKYPDLAALDPTMRGTGAGVYLDSGVMEVSDFAIEPLAAP